MLVFDSFPSYSSGTKYTKKGAVRGRNALAIMYVWTGTLAATPTLWASNLDDPTTADDTDWVQVTDVTLTAPAGSAGKFGITIGNAHFKWYRLKFVHSGGSGNLTVYVDHVSASTRI